MAIISYVGAEITPANNTFQTWLDRTNDIIGDMGSTVITVGDNNNGNVHINGVFSANTIYTGTELKGGDSNTSSGFVISSNVEFTGANTAVTSDEIYLTGNVNINSATSQLNISTLQTTISSANTNIDGFTTISDSVAIDGSISANGSITGLTDIIATGNLTLGGDIEVTGNAVFSSEITFSSNVQSLGVPVGNTATRPSPPEAGMFRFNTDLEEFEGYDGAIWGLIAGGGGLSSTVITTNTNILPEGFYFADTSGGSFTVTLPATPDAGDVIKLAGKTWNTNTLLIARNGNTIEGLAEDLELDVEDAFVEFVYDGTTWQVFTNTISSTGGGTTGLSAPQIIASTYTASSLDFLYADTTSGSFTINLPATPALGDIVKLVGEYWSINNLTIGRNGNTIDNTAEDLIVDVDDVTIEFIWEGTTWAIFTNISGGGSIEVASTTANTEFTMPLIDGTANSYSSVSSANNITFNPSSGTLTVTDVNTLSDVSVKENITSIENNINKLMELNPVEFTWKNNGIKSYGLIAQELETVFPELVNETNDKKYVNYIPMIAMLLEGYKDLSNKIKELENK